MARLLAAELDSKFKCKEDFTPFDVGVVPLCNSGSSRHAGRREGYSLAFEVDILESNATVGASGSLDQPSACQVRDVWRGWMEPTTWRLLLPSRDDEAVGVRRWAWFW
jgi:hypothetical protein